MGLFSRVLRNRTDAEAAEERSLPLTAGGSWLSSSELSTSSALGVAAVWASVRVLSESVAALPIDRYRRIPGGTPEPLDTPRWLDEPNPETNSFELIEQVMTSLLIDGNAYIAVIRDEAGAVLELWVLAPSAVNVYRDSSGRLVYSVGGVTNLEILHIRGKMLPGAFKGLSPIAYGRNAIEAAQAQDRFSATFWSNGAVPGGVIELGDNAEDDDVAQIAAAWNARHGGPANANRTAILTAGASYKPLAIPAQDAQLIETRKYTVSDIARLFGLPGHLVGDLEKASYASVEVLGQEYVTYSLMPWLRRLEIAFSALTDPGQYVRFNVSALLRGDAKSQAETFQIYLQNGVYNLDEVRGILDLAPLPDGLGRQHARPLNIAAITAPGAGTDIGDVVRALQQVYLAVGVVLTADEARDLLNRMGAGLTGPAPTPEAIAA